MAELILSRNGSFGEPENEMSYEFDPENEAALKEILALLSLRKDGGERIEKMLAARCAASMQKKTADSKKITLSGWLSKFKNRFSMLKNKNRNDHHDGRNLLAYPNCCFKSERRLAVNS